MVCSCDRPKIGPPRFVIVHLRPPLGLRMICSNLFRHLLLYTCSTFHQDGIKDDFYIVGLRSASVLTTGYVRSLISGLFPELDRRFKIVLQRVFSSIRFSGWPSICKNQVQNSGAVVVLRPFVQMSVLCASSNSPLRFGYL